MCLNSWSDAKGLGSFEGNSSDWVPSGLNGLSDIDSDGYEVDFCL